MGASPGTRPTACPSSRRPRCTRWSRTAPSSSTSGSPTSIEEQHIEGAINIPALDLRTRHPELPPGRPLVVMCRTGQRSSLACSLLKRAGVSGRPQRGRRLYGIFGGGLFLGPGTFQIPLSPETAIHSYADLHSLRIRPDRAARRPRRGDRCEPEPALPALGLLGITGGTPAADADDYARAEQFLPQSVVPELYNVTVEPHWLGERSVVLVRARRPRRDGSTCWWTRVNGTRRPAFDHARLARALANATGKAVDGTTLPLASVALRGRRRDGHLRRVRPELGARRGRAPRPESGRRTGRRRSRLARRPPRSLPRRRQPLPPRARDRRRPAPYHKRDRGLFYGRIADVSGEPVTAARENGTATPFAVWSPDSRRVRTFQVDQRNVTPLDLLQLLARERHPPADRLHLPLLDARRERGAVRAGRDRRRERHRHPGRPRSPGPTPR